MNHILLKYINHLRLTLGKPPHKPSGFCTFLHTLLHHSVLLSSTPVSIFLHFFSLYLIVIACRQMSFGQLNDKSGGFPRPSFLLLIYFLVFCLCWTERLARMVVIRLGMHSRAFASCETQPLLPFCHCLALLPAGEANKMDLIFLFSITHWN